VEIKVDLHEGVVSLSTLLDLFWVILYRQYDVFPIFLCSSFRRSNGGKFRGDRVSESILR
jgi:hypothetical protein